MEPLIWRLAPELLRAVQQARQVPLEFDAVDKARQRVMAGMEIYGLAQAILCTDIAQYRYGPDNPATSIAQRCS